MIITFFHIAHSLSYVSLRLHFYVIASNFNNVAIDDAVVVAVVVVVMLISIYFPSGTHVCEYFLCHEVSKAIPSNIRHHNSIRCMLLCLCAPVPTTSLRLYSIFPFLCTNTDVLCVCDHEHQATGITSVQELAWKAWLQNKSTAAQHSFVLSASTHFWLRHIRSKTVHATPKKIDDMQKNGAKKNFLIKGSCSFRFVFFLHPIQYFPFARFSGLRWKVNNLVISACLDTYIVWTTFSPCRTHGNDLAS